MTRYLFRPCGMCAWMSDNPFHWGYCTCLNSNQYEKRVHTEDGTCEYWAVWISDNPDAPTPEQIMEWLGGER